MFAHKSKSVVRQPLKCYCNSVAVTFQDHSKLFVLFLYFQNAQTFSFPSLDKNTKQVRPKYM
jgi:hypothetical protein